MNESQNLACRVRPILEAIIEEARNQHADILTEQSWNPDYTLEISLRVREIRALSQLLKAGGREPTTPESTDVKALASASGCADAELLESLYAVIMAMRGINSTMAYTALFNRDHVQDDAVRIENAFKKIEGWRLHNDGLEPSGVKPLKI